MQKFKTYGTGVKLCDCVSVCININTLVLLKQSFCINFMFILFVCARVPKWPDFALSVIAAKNIADDALLHQSCSYSMSSSSC